MGKAPPVEVPMPDPTVEQPLTDVERTNIQHELEKIIAAAASLEGIDDMASIRDQMLAKSEALKKRLHLAKPIAARRAALEAGLERRKATKAEELTALEEAQVAFNKAKLAIQRLDEEIEQFEIELSFLTKGDADSPVMQDPIVLLSQVRDEVVAGRPIPPALLDAMASLTASPLATPAALRVERAGDMSALRISIRSKDPLWSAMRADTARVRHSPY